MSWKNKGKTHEKSFGSPKLGPKLGFLPFPQVFIINLIWYCTGLQLGAMSNI